MPRRGGPDFRSIERLLTRAGRAGHRTLTEIEAKKVLALAGVRVPVERVATSAAHAERLSRQTGFPAVLKIVSRDVVHKTDVRGVELGLRTPEAVRRAYQRIVTRVRQAARGVRIDGVLVQPQLRGREVLVGATQDAQLGPVLVFGLGGTAVEILGDIALRLIPIDRRDAAAMIREIRSAPLLTGYRGAAAVDSESIVRTLLQVSQLMSRFHQYIREIEINPLLVTEHEAVAVDATAVLCGDDRA